MFVYNSSLAVLVISQLFLTAGEQQKEFSPLTAIPEKKENYIELKRYVIDLKFKLLYNKTIVKLLN